MQRCIPIYIRKVITEGFVLILFIAGFIKYCIPNMPKIVFILTTVKNLYSPLLKPDIKQEIIQVHISVLKCKLAHIIR